MKKAIEIITSIQLLMAMTIEFNNIPLLIAFASLFIFNISILVKD